MASPEYQAPPFGLKNPHQAILVIHGIGEQNPYETLDGFARGLLTHFRSHGANAKLCPVEIAHKDWTQVGMRIGFFAADRDLPPCRTKDQVVNPANEPSAYVDVFEYYWAPETEDKLSAANTLKWVLKTDFTPLHYFADNLQEMIGGQHLGPLRALWRSLKLYCRELLRVVVLYLPLALGVGFLLAWLSKQRPWGTPLRNMGTALWRYITWPHGMTHGLILFLYFLCALTIWFGLQALPELRTSPGKSIETVGEKVWFAMDVLLILAFFTIGLAIDRCTRSHALWHLKNVVMQNGKLLLGAGIAWIVSYALTAYVADVAVYTNMDAKSKDYQARNAILKGSTAALKQLLADQKYARVILAGHSLGSVIAYDTINELLAERNADPGPAGDRPAPPLDPADLRKLKGLATFGSPLDKIYYFFREHVKRDQAVRAQILSMLHSFRKKPSGRDYGEFQFNYSFGQLDGAEGLVWINAWALMDPVSARLKFYAPDHQQQFCYCAPVLAHLRYWSDPAFYDYFKTRML
ncbi:MAG TPA: hypothetical protein VN822_08765 [Candidatus Acidoferrales bacterium]|nr:hypothetical protein [Candidatus Acidoferrales bacterium]